MSDINVTERLLKVEHRIRKQIGQEQSAFIELISGKDFNDQDIENSDLKLSVISNLYEKLSFLDKMKTQNSEEKKKNEKNI